MILLDLQAPELVLQDDRHFFGILFLEEIGNVDAGKMRLEGQIEMMGADQSLRLDMRNASRTTPRSAVSVRAS